MARIDTSASAADQSGRIEHHMSGQAVCDNLANQAIETKMVYQNEL